MRKNDRKNWRKKREETEATDLKRGLSGETKKSIAIILIFVLAALTGLAFFDLAGTFGLWLNKILAGLMGWGAYLLPIILLILGYFMLLPEKYAIGTANYLGLIIFISGYLGLLQFIKDASAPASFALGLGGGYAGYLIYLPLQKTMGFWASLIVLIALLLIGLLLTFNTSLGSLMKKINLWRFFKQRFTSEPETEEEAWSDDETESDWTTEEEATAEETSANNPAEAEKTDRDFTKKKINLSGVRVSSKNLPEGLKVTFAHNRRKKIEVPLSLLETQNGKPTSVDIKINSEIIKNTLEHFGILVEMDEINIGPTVTQFTLKPSEGIKLSRITALQNDLALALAAHPIRLEAPIPGRSLVGVEVPNQKIATVKLKDILASDEFKNKKGRLKIGLGQDVSGKAWVVSLAAMPHLLIAGATGSGKSVCINNVIISLLYQYAPEQLKLLIVDPKKVELTNYNGIPHLLTPVITEVDKTINALRWVVREMDERFKLLNSAGKRNIDAYNESVLVNKLPYIVIMVDELADLMAVAARDVEAAIVRLAQMARAVGIHLIVATQRPSVNVITGLIKANITARIAFAVASQVDSRTILDISGAEKLLGKGDMLFTCAEVSKPRRLQGALLTDLEIERVIDFWKQQAEPEYNDEVVESQNRGWNNGVSSDGDGDELLLEARTVVIKAGKASASLLQRRLRVGYARAARLLDLLEEQGVIGPGDGAKPREILVTDDDYLHIPAETTAKYTSADDDEEFNPPEEIEENNKKQEDNEAGELEDENDLNEDKDDEKENSTNL